MLTKDEILNEATEYGLTVIEITTGTNGYPQGLGDHGVIGFDSYDGAMNFVAEHGGKIVEFHSKDGWSLWEDKGYTSNAYSVSELLNKLGDGFGNAYIDKDIYAKELIELLKDFKGDFDAVEKRINEIKEIQEKENNAGDDESVILREGVYYETLKNSFMSYEHDGHKYAVGVLID